MPGIVAFGRRWLIGSDDTIIIGVADFIIYSPWLIWSGLETYDWFFHNERNFCDSTLFLDVTLPCFFSSMILCVILAVGFIHFSRKGTIFQVEARQPCVIMFHIKTILNVLCALLLVFIGYVWCKGDEFCNNSNKKQTFVVLTAAQSTMTLGQFLFWWLIFDDAGSLSKNKKKKKIAQANFSLGSISRKAVNKWKFRLLSLFVWNTYPSRGKRDAINSVAEILAYISHEIDIVFTDFTAGVILMRQKHLRYYQKEALKIDSSPPITLNDGSAVDCFPPTDMPQWMNLYLARRYFHIGLGVFGWRWTLYRNLACGLCKLWNHLICCFPCREKSVVEGDNCCGCNLAGLYINSDVPYRDLIHVSFRNKVYVLPFFVSVDSDTSSVVISVRGTLSFNDVLTDLAAGFQPLESTGGLQDVFCHSGMLKAALRIRDRLEDQGILESAFEGRDGYHLITTGHSLGASVATLLALLLRPSYPLVRCYAFEPPPCVSANGLEKTFDCVFTVVFGNDVVPYLCFQNVELMIQEIVKCIEECNLPKYKVLFSTLSDNDDDNDSPSEKADVQDIALVPKNSEDVQPEENGDAEVEKNIKQEENEKAQEKNSNKNEMTENDVKNKTSFDQTKKTELYVPGRVLHVRYSKNGYRLQVRTAKEFSPLMIRPDMVINHFPQYVGGCLEQLGETYTLLSVNM